MLILWNPTKEKIEGWLRTEEVEFSQKDNRNPNITPHKYLDKYVFMDLHEVFFYDFPHLLQEWILRLKYNHATNQISKARLDPSTGCVVTTDEQQIHLRSQLLA